MVKIIVNINDVKIKNVNSMFILKIKINFFRQYNT